MKRRITIFTVMAALLISFSIASNALAAVNVAENKPVTLSGEFFTNGWSTASIPLNPELVPTDGLFFPKSHEWDVDTVWWSGLDPYLTVDLQGSYEISSFIVQADDNDAYDFYYHDPSDPADTWTPIYEVPVVGGWGMQTRDEFVLEDPITADGLKFMAKSGDNWYSVGEIQAFGVPAPSDLSVTADPASGEAPLDVTFTATMSNPAVTVVEYQWDFDGDGTVDETTTDGTATHAYTVPGTYTATVAAVDDGGEPYEASVDIVVEAPATIPTATLGTDPDPAKGVVPLDVTFLVTLDPDTLDVTSYKWDFDGDGTVDETTTVATSLYTYTVPGAYEAMVTVLFADGFAASASAEVNATSLPKIAQLQLLAPLNNTAMSYGKTGGQITFSFVAVSGAEAYQLSINLTEMITGTVLPLSLTLEEPTTDSWGNVTGTPGFSIDALGIASYETQLDTATWDALASYGLDWSVVALSDANVTSSVIASSEAWKFKLAPSGGIMLTSPKDGATFDRAVDSPLVFQWALYQGAISYQVILARVSGVGFDNVLTFDITFLNQFSMDDAAWQSMPKGKWYWTVVAPNLTDNFSLATFYVQ